MKQGEWSYYRYSPQVTERDYYISADVENIKGVDQIFIFRANEDLSKYYQLAFRYADPNWSNDNNNVTLYRISAGAELLKVLSGAELNMISLSQSVIHKVLVKIEGNRIVVHFDGNKIMDYVDDSENAINTGSVGLFAWGGSFGDYTTNYFHKYGVYTLDHNFSVDNIKLIIIPGLGASWNSDSIIFGKNNIESQWKMTPYVKTYDHLIDSLNKIGKVVGQDYYVWNYDWRKNIDENANKLDEFIKTNVGSNESVDIIGHSLGGVVGRYSLSVGSSGQQVNRVYTIASPNKGVPAAYEAWVGGKVGSKNLSSIAMNVLIQLKKKFYETRLETIRNEAPVLKDLIPVYNFVKVDGLIKPISDLSVVNTLMLNRNSILDTYKDKFVTYSAIGTETVNLLNLGRRNMFDGLLGIWPDGRVVSYAYSDGDGTVPRTSAKFENITDIEISANHDNVVSKSVSDLFQRLGYGDNVTDVGDQENYDGKSVFFIGSPALIKIICRNNVYQSSDFLLLDTSELKGCQLEVVGYEKGKYHLVYGLSDSENNWGYFEGNAAPGKIDKFKYNSSTGLLELSNTDGYYQLINSELDALKSNNSISQLVAKGQRYVERRDPRKILKLAFEIRKKMKTNKTTHQIIDYLLPILVNDYRDVSRQTALSNFNQAKIERKVSYSKRNLERDTFKSEFIKNNLISIDEWLDMAESSLSAKNYPMVAAVCDIIDEIADLI